MGFCFADLLSLVGDEFKMIPLLDNGLISSTLHLFIPFKLFHSEPRVISSPILISSIVTESITLLSFIVFMP